MGALENLLPGNGELGAARGGNLAGHRLTGEQLFPGSSVVCLALAFGVRGLAEWLDSRGTSWAQLATQVDKACLLHKFLLQCAHRVHIAVIHGVDVPAGDYTIAVTVQEDHDVRKVVVVIDQVLEIGESFATLVLRGVRRGIGIVDGVNDAAPSGNIQLGCLLLETQSSHTHSASSAPTQAVSSSLRLAITIAPWLGTTISVVW